jgi:hypothetical protein
MPLPTVSPTERYFTPQTVCVWETGLFIARWYKPSIPATKDEVIALAAASGVTDWYNVGRANFTKLAAGMKLRYGLTGRVVEGAAAAQAAVLAAASAGPCAIGLAGDQLNLTPHWQAGSVGHAIAVLYPPGSGTTGVQLDPLAPQGYAGDPFPPTEMSKFTTAAIVFAGAPKEADMLAVETVTLFEGGPRQFTIPAGTTLNGYDPARPGAPIISRLWSTSSSAPADGRVAVAWPGTAAPPVPNGTPFLRCTAGVYAGLLVLERLVVLAPAPPAPAPDCSQAVADAVAPLNRRIAEMRAKGADIADD